MVPSCVVECQRLKAQVVQEIRANQQLEQDLNIMDIKIGLLVKNRITLQVGVAPYKENEAATSWAGLNTNVYFSRTWCLNQPG